MLRKIDLPRAKKMHTAKSLFAECQNKGTRQNTSLPSARKKHSAKTYFAVCQKIALGKIHLCRVPEKKHSAKTYFAVCFCLPSVFYLALGKHGLCRVPNKIHSAKIPALGKVPISGSVTGVNRGFVLALVLRKLSISIHLYWQFIAMGP